MKKEKEIIEIEDGDAPAFIKIVNSIMDSLVTRYFVKEVVFVKIKNWFDHKWLNYSGKTTVFYDFAGLKGKGNNTSLQSEWREKISIPPFNPNRVIYSRFLINQPTGNKKIEKSIHRCQNSNNNIHNRIEDYTSDGLVIWFSSNSIINNRGSLMAYRVQDSEVFTLYATIENSNGWKITKTKGIGLDELKTYIEDDN